MDTNMKIVLLYVFLFLLASASFGQATLLSGVIFDRNGAVIVGAGVNAKAASGKVRVAKTDSNGSYSLSLDPGVYAIDVSNAGFVTLKIEEYFVVASTLGKFNQDFVLFGLSPHATEPCGYSGAECMDGKEKIVFEITVKHSPKLKSLEN